MARSGPEPRSSELDSVVAQMAKYSGLKELTRYERRLPPALLESHASEQWTGWQERLIDLHLAEMKWQEPQRTLLNQVSAETLAELFSRYQDRTPSLDEWAHMHDRVSGLRRWFFGLGVVAILEAVGLVVLTIVLILHAFFFTRGFTLEPLLQVGSFVRLLVDACLGVIGMLPDWHIWRISVRSLVAVIILCVAAVWVGRRIPDWRLWPMRTFLRFAMVTGIALPLVVPTAWLHTNLGSWGTTFLVWLALVAPPAVVGVLFGVLRVRQDNPIRGGLTKYTSRATRVG